MAAGGGVLQAGNTANVPHSDWTLGLKLCIDFWWIQTQSGHTTPLISPIPDILAGLVGLASPAQFQIHVDFPLSIFGLICVIS